jgi:2-polyprenyl-3-methyl-5-hydroxy-6-metoxy-1,4-benzoquinol methylase
MANSPITTSNNTKLIFTLPSEVVINKYKTQAKIDISEYFENINQLELWECLDTNYRFYYPFSLAGSPKFYEDIQQTEATKSHKNDGYYPKWKSENQFALNFISKNSSVLDIGCGEGNFLIKLSEMGIRNEGIEFNKEAVTKCKSKGLNVEIKTIETLRNEGKTYDVITLFQVLEHIQDIKGFVEDILSILKVGGTLIIGVPDNDPYYAWYDAYQPMNLPPHHMGLWNEKTFRKFSTFFNLEFIDVQHDAPRSIFHSVFFFCHFYASKITKAYERSSWSNFFFFPILAPFAIFSSLLKRVQGKLYGETIVVALKKTK